LYLGIMYFFSRPRVDVGDEPHSVGDIQRSFLVLRPVAGVETKPAKDSADCRVLILPKKKMPSASKHERFLTFVKEPKISVKDMSEQFESETYSTKTKGERTQPAALPIAEAVYALITSPDKKATHLAYMLTIPDELDNIHKELNIQKQASYVVQTRNPKTPAPPQAGVPDPPTFSDEIMEQFHGLRWVPLRPEHLDYKHCEILFIGAHKDISRGGAEEAAAVEELEELEEGEEQRVNHLGDEDTIFKDLRLRRDEFKKMSDVVGTWG